MAAEQPGRSGAARAAAMAVALAFLFVAVLAIATNVSRPYQTDFLSYWSAARLALAGNPAGAYDFVLHGAVERSAAALQGALPFANPPPFLLVLAPFGLFPYPIAAAAWIVATAALYLLAARRFAPGSAWLAFAFPPVLVNAITGQSGFLTAALFLGGLALLRTRPFVAGLLLGCLVVKPQLALALPFVLLAGKEWRAILGAACGSLGLALAGLAVYGWAAYAAWLGNAPLFASVLTEGRSGWDEMASLYATLRLAGAGNEAAWALHLLVAGAALLTACWVWRSDREPGAKAAILAAATALASPYLYVYDTVLLVAPLLWLHKRGANGAVLAALWCLPFVSLAAIAGLPLPVNPMPLVAAALILLILRAP
jgi:arabinofuranan 3-O-arabinosyltransferase